VAALNWARVYRLLREFEANGWTPKTFMGGIHSDGQNIHLTVERGTMDEQLRTVTAKPVATVGDRLNELNLQISELQETCNRLEVRLSCVLLPEQPATVEVNAAVIDEPSPMSDTAREAMNAVWRLRDIRLRLESVLQRIDA